MKSTQFKKACHELQLAPRDLAGVLGILDRDAIRLWSTGGVPIPSPIVQRIQNLLRDWRRANTVADRVIEKEIMPRLERELGAPEDIGLTVYDDRSIARLKAEEPSVTLSMHNLVNRATTLKLAVMGVPVRLTVIAEDAYAAWLGEETDGKAKRGRFARDVALSYPVGLPLTSSPLGQAILRMKDIPATLKLLESRR